MKPKAHLVIGSAGGIGRAIVADLLGAGHEVIGMDKAAVEGESKLTALIHVDLADNRSTSNACQQVRDRVGQLESIIYAAGVYPMVEFDRYTLELWEEVQRVNSTAAFIILRELGDMIRDGGRVVTIVSGAAHTGSRDIAYSASKASLLGLTRSLALSLAPRGILVNAVCPGPVTTPMSARMSKERVLEYKSRMPLRRFGRPEEVAAAVSFLLSHRNSFMTGASIDVDGGLYRR